ncbi:MAG: ParA family protein [Methylococcaceae bacterium]|jgi:cellulose biosynthesis protein BcsQ
MKIISFFNHKGGVSKTTSVYHLGWMLTKKGKKVLLVDTDSQCNLTLTVIGQDNYEEFVTTQPQNNIKSGLSAAFEAKPELIKPVKCVQVKNNKNLFLLPGSFEITEYEVQLGVSFQLTHSFTTMKNLPGAFYYLIRRTAEEMGVDIVLIDLNPSLSAINQDLIISSDYFILPTSPDYFSEMAIKSIARILPNWEKWAKQARALSQDATYPLPTNTPKFLGYTVNDFTIYDQEPTKAFQDIIKKIDQTVKNILIPSLDKVGMLLNAESYNDNYRLAEVSNFQSLQAHYQKHGLPVFELTGEMLGLKGAALTSQQERQDNFKSVFSGFSDRVIELMDYAENH